MEVLPLALLLGCPLLVSLSFNAFLFFRLKHSKKQPAPTLDAQTLLHDLMQGGAVLRITVLNPEGLFLRSPKG
jgi:hypothetical protein